MGDDAAGYFPDPALGSGLELPREVVGRSAGAQDHPAAPLVLALGSADPTEARGAARALFEDYRSDPLVQEQAWLRLDAGYRDQQASWSQVDAMAWLCNILGASGNERYRALLDEVSRQAPSRKLRRYARKNLERSR